MWSERYFMFIIFKVIMLLMVKKSLKYYVNRKYKKKNCALETEKWEEDPLNYGSIVILASKRSKSCGFLNCGSIFILASEDSKPCGFLNYGSIVILSSKQSKPRSSKLRPKLHKCTDVSIKRFYNGITSDPCRSDN